MTQPKKSSSGDQPDRSKNGAEDEPTSDAPGASARRRVPLPKAARDFPELSDLASRMITLGEELKSLAHGEDEGTPPSPPPGVAGREDAPEPDEQAIPKIKEFLGELHGFLYLVVHRQDLLPDDERREMVEFFGEISEAFGRCQAALLTEAGMEEGLRQHGLWGRQLRFKLRRWQKRLAEFLGDISDRRAARAIHPASIVLGSLASLLGPAGEPIKEALQGIDELLTRD